MSKTPNNEKTFDRELAELNQGINRLKDEFERANAVLEKYRETWTTDEWLNAYDRFKERLTKEEELEETKVRS